MGFHLDTDFVVHALSRRGPERHRLDELAGQEVELAMSAVAWYEFARGPRTPEQLAVARGLFLEEGIVPLSEELASRAADTFRRLGSPRKRAADIAIGVTAAEMKAVLLTRNANDFAGIEGLTVEAVAG